MCSLEVNDVSDLLGKPWVRAATGPESYDCWGLVKECLSRINISTEIKVDYSFPQGIEHEFEQSLNFWRELETAENNCIIYGYIGNIPSHIGFMIDDYVIHSIGDVGSETGYVSLTKLKHFKRLYNRVGFYKWQN